MKRFLSMMQNNVHASSYRWSSTFMRSERCSMFIRQVTACHRTFRHLCNNREKLNNLTIKYLTFFIIKTH